MQTIDIDTATAPFVVNGDLPHAIDQLYDECWYNLRYLWLQVSRQGKRRHLLREIRHTEACLLWLKTKKG